MEERLARLEATVGELARQVEEIQRRLAALDAAAASPLAHVGPEPQPPIHGAAAVERPGSDVAALLAFAGRSVLILGGAYLLRALTESGALGPSVGPLLGLLYATAWILAVWRADGAHREANAAFQAMTASVIGFPLIWEATVHFGVLRPPASAAALGALTGVALTVAWRRNHRSLAWIVSLAAMVTAVALIPASGAVLPYAVLLLLLGLATLWLGYVRDWTLLRWPVALVTDVVALGLVSRALGGAGPESAGPVLAVLSALVAGYLASTAVRTLVRGREVVPFEVTQTGLALLIGFGGAIAVSRATGTGARPLGAISLFLACATYVVAFAFIRRTQPGGVNFFFYTSLALVFTLVGGELLLGPAAMAFLAAALAVASAWLGGRANRAALHLQAAIYLIAASIFSGLLVMATQMLFGGAGVPVPWHPAAMGAVVLAAACCAALSARGWAAEPPALVSIGTLAIVILLTWGAAGFLVAVAASGASTVLRQPIGAGGIGAIGTAILSALTIALAVAGRRWLVEAGRLVYPLLLVTGAKVVAIDLRQSSALLLVLAFVSYGIALIIAPRALRGQAARAPRPAAPAEPLEKPVAVDESPCRVREPEKRST